MREKQNYSSPQSTKYRLLNDIPTEALKNMIRLDCFGSEEDQLDTDTIETILAIISQREQKGGEIDINTLWDNFQSEYMPTINQPELMTHEDLEKCATSAIIHKKPLRFLRHVLIAALLCLLLGNCVAYASGVNIFEHIARWTKETFHFEKANSTSFQVTEQNDLGDEIKIKGES